jgi:hypothetical protein
VGVAVPARRPPVLEALPPAALAGFRDEFTARVATGGGAELRSEFLYWRFTLPG